MSRYKGKKGKAWEAVKAYVRAKEKDCFTCGARGLQGINAQAGHYLPVGLVGSNNALSWDERQIHLQCSRCNGVGQGEQVAYKKKLLLLCGDKVVEELEGRKYKVNPIKDWDKVIDHYKELLVSLSYKL